MCQLDVLWRICCTENAFAVCTFMPTKDFTKRQHGQGETQEKHRGHLVSSEFLKSVAWQQKREKILKRDGYQCQVAKRYGKKIPAKIVHHIFPRSEHPEWSLCDWNLISVSPKGHSLLETDDGLTEMGKALCRKVAREKKLDVEIK